jgi:ABC-2 type transport system ATP-binding protein
VNTDIALKLVGLTKNFGRHQAVKNVSFSVPNGSVVGFLGRNGAGKSTTIKMMLGLLSPSAGHTLIFGHNATFLPDEVRARIGYMPEGHPIHEGPKVVDAERLQAALYPRWDAKLFTRICSYFGLDRNARVSTLSRGQRAGLSLALTFGTQPELLVMDDPTLGLDPLARHAFLEATVYIAKQNTSTIVLSSHWLADIERVADKLVILDNGELKLWCSVDEFREQIHQLDLTFKQSAPNLEQWPGLLSARDLGNHRWRVTIVSKREESIEQATAQGASSIEERPLNFEQAFIEYIRPNQQAPSFFEVVESLS